MELPEARGEDGASGDTYPGHSHHKHRHGDDEGEEEVRPHGGGTEGGSDTALSSDEAVQLSSTPSPTGGPHGLPGCLLYTSDAADE